MLFNVLPTRNKLALYRTHKPTRARVEMHTHKRVHTRMDSYCTHIHTPTYNQNGKHRGWKTNNLSDEELHLVLPFCSNMVKKVDCHQKE